MQTIDRRLIEACPYGDVLTVEQLLQQGANPNAKDDCWPYRTALIIATQHGHIPIINLLIQHGADPHATDRDGQTALHYAVLHRHHEIVQYLITELKLDPNTQDRHGITPFMIATLNGDIHMLQLLIQHGTNPNTTDHKGQTALHYAAYYGHDEAAQYLITQLHINPNIQDPWGQTPLLLTIQRNDIHMLQLLAQHGADPNIPDHNGQTALHHALKKWYLNIAQYLITQLHINPNTQDNNGITPFLIATQNGDIKILRLLIQNGADPYATDHQGRSALHYALEYRHHDIAQYLLTELQIDPNIQDDNGITPFLLATKKHDIKILRLLIQLGANPYATDKDGRSALHYAIKYYHHNIFIFKYLITQLQLDPNAQDHDGDTPLLIAIKYKGKFIANAIKYKVKFIANTLIQLGANPHIPNHQGQTPAAIARQREILLEKPQPSFITL